MKNTGDGRRKIRVEREVQLVISQFIISNLKADIPGLVTVTRIQMPSDFRAAQVFVTYYNPDTEAPKIKVAKVLQSWAKDIQDEIGHKLKMRYCPKITFFEDESTERILKIERLLSNLTPEQKAQLDADELEAEDDEEETP
ncbi:MAG: 30S ribosome-binding factor RbfA [Bdellovibrionaceae bacterium]|nr:30S ribosome-binding factor RbfA [Bdellovibrio sp.]